MKYYFTRNILGKIPAFAEIDPDHTKNCFLIPSGSTITDATSEKKFNSLSWGLGVGKGFSITGEHGFFRNASWMDKKGIYFDCSLNTEEGKREVLDFEPPVDLTQKIIQSNINTKYSQPISSVKWGGVVLASQNPLDYNIAYLSPFKANTLGGHDKYMAWYEAQCKKYGATLLVKLHPFTSEIREWGEIFVKIADRYGCSAAMCNMDCFDTAEKVITYTSTIALDCWMRGVECEQHAPGTFMNYSLKDGRQLANFLMWKYCFPTNITLERLKDLMAIYTSSPSIFPIPKEYSWGQWYINTCNEDGTHSAFSNDASGLSKEERVFSGTINYSN